MPGTITREPAGLADAGPCPHNPPCPPADASDAMAAHIVSDHPELNWSLLCNGLILVDHKPINAPARTA